MKLALAFCLAALLGSAQSGPQSIAVRLFKQSRLGGGEGIITGMLRHGMFNLTSQSAQGISKSAEQTGQMAQMASQVGGQMAEAAASKAAGVVANVAGSAANTVGASSASVQAVTNATPT